MGSEKKNESKFQDIHPTAMVGDGTKIWNFVYIGEYVIIGNNCMIANFVHIDRDVKIGNNCKIQSMVYVPEYTKIGNNCMIYSNVCIINEKYPPNKRKAGVVIEDNCIVGAGAILQAGITLGEGCVVGAGSIVLDDVKPREVVFGVPAHRHYLREEYEEKKREWDLNRARTRLAF